MDQLQRLNRATRLGVGAAAVMAFIAALIMTQFQLKIILILLPLLAAGSAFISVFFIWRRAMLKRETRKRGFWMGVLSGCVALIIMLSILGWAIAVPDAMKGNTFDGNVVMSIIIGPIMTIVFGFAFGGFIALPAGGLLGWLFSRNIDQTISDNFE